MKSNLYKIIGLTILVTSNLGKGHAQSPSSIAGNVTISSPTAASLGKYGDIPVNYHTGIPQIDIPLYTVKAGALELPISLSYHASGIKVLEYASWVGSGWSLNAGGAITRTIRGAPDDKGYKGYQGFVNNCTHGYYSDYGYQSYLMVTSAGSVLPSGKMTDDQSFLNGLKDGEPDLFFFNFAGYSGKFYFNDDRTPVLVPETDMKIEAEYILGPGFNGFILTTSDGVKYYFGRTGNYSSSTDPVELTIPSTITGGPGNTNAAASSWYLNKIIAANGVDSVTFQYEAEAYSYYTWSMFAVPNYTGTWTTLAERNGVDLVKNFVNGVRLSEVNFPGGNVKFIPSAQPRTDLSTGFAQNSGMSDVANTNAFALGSIEISNENGYCKKDSFYYSYSYDNINNNFHSTFWGSNLDIYNLQSDRNCLRLDSIRETTCNNVIQIPPYKFDYFTGLVPRRLSFGVDHWGYYNGVNNNTGLIPTHIVQYQSVLTQKNGANRDASWPAMRGGALQKITYPTGGFTEFEFEPHSTYCNYDTYALQNRLTMGAGYDGHNGWLGDGGSNPDSAHFTFTGNQYMLIVSNTTQGGIATVEIYNSSNNLIYNTGSIALGQTDTFHIDFPAGNYWFKLTKNNAMTGYGAQLTLYEMEPVPVSGNITVGGLRIKAIRNNDGFSAKDTVTNYSYYIGNNLNGNSSGILYSRPVYVKLVKNEFYNTVFPYSSCGVMLCSGIGGGLCANASDQYYKSPTSVRPMETTMGNHIGYNEVYVTRPGNGYSVYRYYGSNVWDNIISDVCVRMVDWDNPCSNTVPNTPEPPAPFEFKRGLLKYEGHFNQSGLVLKDVWYFPSFELSPFTTPGHIAAMANNIAVFTEYSLASARKIADSTEETTYDPATSSYVTSTTVNYFESLYHNQPSKTVTHNSTGKKLITNNKYAFDFRIVACDTLDNGISTYESNSYADTVAFQSALNTCTPQGPLVNPFENCRYISSQQFRENLSTHRVQFIQTRRTNFTDPGNNYDVAHLNAKNAAGSELKPILELQDVYQNALIEQSQWKDQNLLDANFIRYDYSDNPSDKVFPERAQQIHLSTPSGSFTGAQVVGNSITKDNRFRDENFFKYLAGVPAQVQSHDGLYTSYLWDPVIRQPVAKVLNSTVDEIVYTSFEATYNGNWTIGSPDRIDTISITGSLSYDLSEGDISWNGLNSSTSYIVSYWTTNSNSFIITGTQGSAIEIGQAGNWYCFMHRITGVGQVTITGSGLIDELRLYRQGAQMITYSYEPLIGMTSECDINNRITYYEYDDFGRLEIVKDEEGHIIKRICYNYAGQPSDCDPINVYVQWAYENIDTTDESGYRTFTGDVYFRLYDAEGNSITLNKDLVVSASWTQQFRDTSGNVDLEETYPFEPLTIPAGTHAFWVTFGTFRYYPIDVNGNMVGDTLYDTFVTILPSFDYIVKPWVFVLNL